MPATALEASNIVEGQEKAVDTDTLATRSKEDVLRRNEISESFFEAEAPMLAKLATRCSRLCA